MLVLPLLTIAIALVPIPSIVMISSGILAAPSSILPTFLNQAPFPDLNSKIKILSIESDLETVLLSVIVVVAGVIVARIIKSILNRLLREKVPKGSRVLIERIAFYSIVFLAGLAALSNIGVDFTGALLAGGIVGIIIGFATQSVVSNLLSGIFLHLDRPLEIGEPVEIEDMSISGVVTDITAFSTRLRKFDGTFVRVPNDKLFTSRIRNFNRYPARRIETKVGISYKEDVTHAIEIIKSRLEVNSLILAEPAPDIFLDALSESSVDLFIFAWTAKPVFFQVKKQFTEDIKISLDKAGIEIPFPQRVIHLHHSPDDLDTTSADNEKEKKGENEKQMPLNEDDDNHERADDKKSSSNNPKERTGQHSSQGFHDPSGNA